MRGLLYRGRVWLVTAGLGGSVLILEGCDTTVRDTVLQGVGTAATSLSTTFISAFIQSLTAEEDETATTVRATFEVADQIFA